MSLPNADLGDAEPEGLEAANSADQKHPLVILAIDDDPGILNFYQAVMSDMDVRFESSTNPAQALDLVTAHDPSLVILDLTMPGVDGMELLRRIKSRRLVVVVFFILLGTSTYCYAKDQGGPDVQREG